MKYIDLDFFQPERDRVAEKRKAMIPLLIGCIIIFLLIVIYFMLQYKENELNDELVELTSETTTEQVNISTLSQEINDTNALINVYEEGNDTPLGMKLNDIQAAHLRSIMASTPNEAFYKDITIKDNLLTLDGYTKSTQVVAKIVYNLESTNYFEEVVISNIAKDEDNGYSFTIDAFIKE